MPDNADLYFYLVIRSEAAVEKVMFVEVREANFTVLYNFCTCGLNDSKPLEVTPDQLLKTNKGIL